MKSNVFVLRADFGRYTSTFEKEGYIGIGWFEVDPQGWDLTNKEFLKEKYRQVFPNDPSMRMNQNVGQINRFVNDIKIGDLVLSPYMDNQLLVGRIESDLYFKSDNTSPYPWRKAVKWYKEKIDRHTLSVPLQNTLRSSLTCFNVNSADEVLVQLGLLDKGLVETSTGAKYEPTTNLELIRKRFLELDATEFEYLVSYLLRTLGFEPTQEIGKVGDGGIDFEGVLDVSGIASINLQVQVKRYDKGVIGEEAIKSFRGALKENFQGCFITLSTFNKKAMENAADKDRKKIQLIDGKIFTEIFIEQYDKIIDSMYKDDNDDLAGKLKFKKSLLPI
jgi:restriction system protein